MSRLLLARRAAFAGAGTAAASLGFAAAVRQPADNKSPFEPNVDQVSKKNSSHGSTMLRIGSLNCQYLFDAEALAAAVSPHGPFDVLALQEVRSDGEVLQRFAAALGMQVAVEKAGDKMVQLSNALLVRSTGAATATAAWTLHSHRESRSAVAVDLDCGLRVVCTHLDHRDEDVRLNQLSQLSTALGQSSPLPLLLLGDFNALRRLDYSDAAWEALVRSRARVDIESETRVTEELQRPPDATGGWGLTDCRAVAGRVGGETATSVYGARVDYVWASAAALEQWRVAEHAHVDAARMHEPDGATDHALVVCVLEQNN